MFLFGLGEPFVYKRVPYVNLMGWNQLKLFAPSKPNLSLTLLPPRHQEGSSCQEETAPLYLMHGAFSLLTLETPKHLGLSFLHAIFAGWPLKIPARIGCSRLQEKKDF